MLCYFDVLMQRLLDTLRISSKKKKKKRISLAEMHVKGQFHIQLPEA